MTRQIAIPAVWMVVVLTGAMPAGSADRAELEAAFQAWDRDGNGKLTEDEWHGKVPFLKADRNSDKVVTLEELLGEEQTRSREESSDSGSESEPDPRWARMTERWDSNGDGGLAAEEWRGRTPHKTFDKDGNGTVSQKEFLSVVGAAEEEDGQPHSPSWQRALQAWDTDDDGRLAADEWSGKIPFEKLDADSNGQITEAEFRIALGLGAGDAQPVSEAPHSADFELLLKAMDGNRDGQVSHDEWNGGTSDWEDLDANNDGFISADEMP
jgi:Ca2+-binding EF-hand superfamily protein